MMTAEQLKNSILQLAMQGQLVDQNPAEGNGAENLALIEKDYKVKKKFSINEDEFPFDIPSSWVWTKVGNITNLYNGRAFKPSDWTDDGLPIVRIQNLNDRNAPYNRYNGAFDEVYHLYGGELLFAWSGTPGTSFGAHIWRKEEAVLNQHIFKIEFPEKLIDKLFFAQALNFQVLNLIRLAHGSAGLQHVTKGVFQNTLIPLPPLAEQKRIVAKIKELMPFVDQYAAASTKLNKLNTSFPDMMKKSILQEAVQGKLVPQDPNEEPASELLKRIAEEKQRLIKEGKIKKQKAFPEITEDEIPFDIPDSWAWVRLIDILEEKPTNGYSPKGVDYITNYKNLTLTAATSGVFNPKAFKYVDIPPEKASSYYLKKNDILVERSNSPEYVGISCLYDHEDDEYIYPDLIMRMHLLDGLIPKYVVMVLQSPFVRRYYQKSASGSSKSMPKINQQVVSETLIPIPPKEEQKRIVSAFENLAPQLCLLDASKN